MKYRFSDILLKKHKRHLRRLFCCNHTCYCVNMVSVTSASRCIMSASRYHPRYQSKSAMYIHGLIPRNFTEFAEVVSIVVTPNIARPLTLHTSSNDYATFNQIALGKRKHGVSIFAFTAEQRCNSAKIDK